MVPDSPFREAAGVEDPFFERFDEAVPCTSPVRLFFCCGVDGSGRPS